MSKDAQNADVKIDQAEKGNSRAIRHLNFKRIRPLEQKEYTKMTNASGHASIISIEKYHVRTFVEVENKGDQ